MQKILDKIREWALNLLLPRFCVSCGKEGEYICDSCSIFLSESPNTIDKLVSIWEYEGITEKLICSIKYEKHFHILNEICEKAFGVMLKDVSRFQRFLSFLLAPDTYITYVPMHKRQERKRGFNQSELIAKKIGEMTNKKEKILPLLIKTRDNLSQVGLSPKEREENVKGVFEFWTNFGHAMSIGHRMSTSHVQNVLLVDDVYTTGATMRECTRVLKRAGAKNIWGFTLARKFNI